MRATARGGRRRLRRRGRSRMSGTVSPSSTRSDEGSGRDADVGQVVEELTYDMANVSSATQLLEKRKQVLDVERELEATRGEVNRNLENVGQEEVSLQEKRRELTNNIISLDKFIVENERRKNKAVENQHREVEELDHCVSEIEQTKLQIEELEREYMMKSTKLHRYYNQYADYLRSVVEKTLGQASREEAKQVMKKHANLKKNQDHLNEFVQMKEAELMNETKKLKRFEEQAKSEQLTLDNEITKLMNDLDRAKTRADNLQKAYDDHVARLADAKVVEGQIHMACQYLFNRVSTAMTRLLRKTRATPDPSFDSRGQQPKHRRTMDMLQVIRNHVESIHDVCELVDQEQEETPQ